MIEEGGKKERMKIKKKGKRKRTIKKKESNGSWVTRQKNGTVIKERGVNVGCNVGCNVIELWG